MNCLLLERLGTINGVILNLAVNKSMYNTEIGIKLILIDS